MQVPGFAEMVATCTPDAMSAAGGPASRAFFSLTPRISLKNSTSRGLEPGHPPSMYCTPNWSSFLATRTMSLDGKVHVLGLRAVTERGIVELHLCFYSAL
jgi:hypothetical protein